MGHGEVFRMGSVGTSIIGRPRPLSGHRRAHPRYTLECDEPLDGQVTIDASNTFGDRPPGYDSIAQQVKAIIGGPTAKAFNTNFASIYDAVDAEPMPPGTLFASDADAREATESLIRDAGFEPIHLGDLAKAPLLESLITLTSTLDRGELGPFFYRFNRPGELAAQLGLNPR
ncbi:hypothetical protein ACSVHC_15215 [Arthrobacter sp. KNU-44]|uniref:hypothetical protein n=1 Tax=Arthrobacter sp. KNU-44 TaxID=3450744 RepID=UPI003F43DFF5